MSISMPKILKGPRRSHLAGCLMVAFSAPAFAAPATEGHGDALFDPNAASTTMLDRAQRFSSAYAPASKVPALTSSDWPASISTVTNCNDSGPGSLRDEVLAAMSGATIDLSQLACSTITLGSEIVVLQDNLRVIGPGGGQLTIDGDSSSRIFKHTGNGVLNLYDLSMENGYYDGFGSAEGGCIASSGSLVLVRSIVSHCALHGTNAVNVHGGAVSAHGLTMVGSEISMSIARSIDGAVLGGAAYVGTGDCEIKYSTIRDNTAYTPSSSLHPSFAGGVYAVGVTTIESSTISGNRSESYAGLAIMGGVGYSASIINSTISSNVAEMNVGGIMTKSPLTLFNTTIAFNTAHDSSNGAGLYVKNLSPHLYNTIISGNGGPSGAGDFCGDIFATIIGSNNVIVASTRPLPLDTIQACPKLEPLADNGGFTLTHALNHSSPAIDQGASTPNLQYDQRSAPRFAGPQEDIGSVEWQPGETDERLLASGFDGLCDQ